MRFNPDHNVTTIFEGIQTIATEKGYSVDFFDSGENIRKIKDQAISQAANKAKESDYAIDVVGDNSMRYRWKDKTAGEKYGKGCLRFTRKAAKIS